MAICVIAPIVRLGWRGGCERPWANAGMAGCWYGFFLRYQPVVGKTILEPGVA